MALPITMLASSQTVSRATSSDSGIGLPARLLELDALTSKHASEMLSTRLWRRYGSEALGMLEAIRRDPRQAEVIIETSEYIRCELDAAARREMIVKL